MKIDIEMGFKKEVGEIDPAYAKPYANIKIDITKEEVDSLKKTSRELFEAIAIVLRFTVQMFQ